eukprot:521371-Pelagomonas_calceolata.AAC.2
MDIIEKVSPAVLGILRQKRCRNEWSKALMLQVNDGKKDRGGSKDILQGGGFRVNDITECTISQNGHD